LAVEAALVVVFCPVVPRTPPAALAAPGPAKFSWLVDSFTTGEVWPAAGWANDSVVVERWSKSRSAFTRTTAPPGPVTGASMSSRLRASPSSNVWVCVAWASPASASPS
jgi:hypothetical protein